MRCNGTTVMLSGAEDIVVWNDVFVNGRYQSILQEHGLDCFEKVITTTQGQVVKRGRWGEVRKIHVGSEWFFLKRRLSGERWLRDLLRLRAGKSLVREWENHWLCCRLGLPVPDPVAAGTRGALWRQQSFVMSRAVDGAPLLSKLSELSCQRRKMWKLVEQVACVARQLHMHRIYHNDLYFDHFLVSGDEAGHWQITLLDLNRIEVHRKTRANRIVKDLAKLLLSARIDAALSRTDTLRLVHAYFQKRRLEAADRRVLARAMTKAQWIRAHTPRYAATP